MVQDQQAIGQQREGRRAGHALKLGRRLREFGLCGDKVSPQAGQVSEGDGVAADPFGPFGDHLKRRRQLISNDLSRARLKAVDTEIYRAGNRENNEEFTRHSFETVRIGGRMLRFIRRVGGERIEGNDFAYHLPAHLNKKRHRRGQAQGGCDIARQIAKGLSQVLTQGVVRIARKEDQACRRAAKNTD